MSVSVTFWGNLADAPSQLLETRFAGSLLDGVVRSVAHCDRAADSFCAHIGGQVAAVAIVSRDHHQVVLADRRRLDCDHDLAPPAVRRCAPLWWDRRAPRELSTAPALPFSDGRGGSYLLAILPSHGNRHLTCRADLNGAGLR